MHGVTPGLEARADSQQEVPRTLASGEPLQTGLSVPTGADQDPFRTSPSSPSAPPSATDQDPYRTAAPGTVEPLETDSSLPPSATDQDPYRTAGPTPEAGPCGAGAEILVPGYENQGVLGRGGMGVVYKARHVQLKRVVALKMILGGAHVGPEHRARFYSEAQAVARLQHPHIVQIYEIGEHEGRPFLSLEFADGGSLDKKLAGRPQPPAPAAAFLETIARAVHAAHERGIIHRDLKPANILLQIADRRSQIEKKEPASIPQSAICDLQFAIPKITDFGLAKQLDDESQQTRSGAIMGTPSFMAPEQAVGKTGAIGPATDVYALAVILYEMLTGRPPFTGATVWEILDQVRHQEPLPPSHLQPRLPRDLETICLKGLRKEPGQRYPSALALADDLRRFLNGEPIRARPVSPCECALKAARRRPALAGMLLALTFLFLVGAGWLTQHLYREMHRSQLRIEAQDWMFAGQQALADQRKTPIAARQWGDAQLLFSRALTIARSDPVLADLEEKVEPLLVELELERTQQQRFQADQEQYHAFIKSGNRALFHETLSTTGLNREGNALATRTAAREALQQYGVTLASSGPPTVSTPNLDDKQKANIVETSYELLLAWAEATAYPVEEENTAVQARQSLKILDRAVSVGLVTQAYHLRRLRYLAQLKDAEGVRRELEQVKKHKPATSVDYFLLALEALHLESVPDAERLLQEVLPADHDDAAPRARRYLLEALKLEPEHYWANYCLASYHLRERRWDAARASLEVCLKQNQDDFLWPYLLRGFAHGMAGDQQAAEADFAQAERRSPDDTVRYGIYVNRAVTRFEHGKKTRRQAAELTEAGHENARNLRQRAEKALDDAVDELQRAIQLRPKQYQAYVNLAEVLQQQGKLDEARSLLDQALALQPLASLYRSRARLHLQRKDYPSALPDLEQAIARHPPGLKSLDHAEDHLEVGRIVFRSRRWEDALAAFRKAERAHPHAAAYSLPQRLRAEALFELGRYQEAAAALDRYFERGGAARADVYRTRALIRTRLGNFAGAVDDYTQALQIDELHLKQATAQSSLRKGGKEEAALAQTYASRGWALLVNESPRLALRDFEKALQLDGGQPDYYSGRGTALILLGNSKGAVSDAETSLRLRPPTARLLSNAGRIYSQAAALLQADPGARERHQRETRQRWEDQALTLIRQALQHVPAAERAQFWKDFIQTDPGLKHLRPTASYAQLAAEFARPANGSISKSTRGSDR